MIFRKWAEALERLLLISVYLADSDRYLDRLLELGVKPLRNEIVFDVVHVGLRTFDEICDEVGPRAITLETIRTYLNVKRRLLKLRRRFGCTVYTQCGPFDRLSADPANRPPVRALGLVKSFNYH